MNLRFLFAGALVAGTAGARTYNYQEIPIGERAFGMGNASMAIGGETSNMFSNPGILALSQEAQFSASLSAFSRVDTRTGQYVSLFQSAQDNVSKTNFLSVPAMVGGHVKWGEWVWGGSILVPDAFQSSGVVNLSGGEVGAFAANDATLWAGMFAARSIDERHTIGLSIFYVSRTESETFEFTTPGTPTNRIHNINNGFGVSGLVLVVGSSYQWSESFRIGYSLRLPPLKIGGTVYYVDTLSTASGITNLQGSTGFFPLPARFSVGAAWRISPVWLVAADFHLYSAMHGELGDASVSQFNVAARVTPNLSLGTEYYPWQDVGFRLGFFTNMSSAENAPVALSVINDKVHMFGGTAAVVFTKASLTTFSVGGYVEGGQGTSSQFIENPTATASRSNYFYGLAVGSSKKF